jgi:tetratricopeptide (TPR) repeat protein
LPGVSAASELDLPAPGRPKPAAPPPAPSARSVAADDLPAIPEPRAPEAAPLDLDLPAAVAPPPVALDVDLPAPARPRAPSFSDALVSGHRGEARDLDLPAPRGPALDLDLPDVGAPHAPSPGSRGGTFDLDLPDVLDAGLPEPVPAAGKGAAPRVASRPALPAISAELPSPAAALPSPAAGLPAVAAELPSRAEPRSPEPFGGGVGAAPGFGELELELERPNRRTSGTFDEIELPPVIPSARPAAPNSPPQAAALDPLEADPFGEAPIPSVPARGPASVPSLTPVTPGGAVVRSTGGGTSYGEVNLDGGGGSGLDMEAPLTGSVAPRVDEDMEFGALPQERHEAPAATAAAKAMGQGMPAVTPKHRARWPLRVFGGLLVVAVAGGSLSFVPALGPYGAYWISDRLHAGQHARLLDESIADTRRAFGRDVFPDARRALASLEAASAGAKRFEPLAAYLAFAGYASELRFGRDAATHSRGSVILRELRDPNAAYADSARAASRGVEGDVAAALQAARGLAAARPGDIDAKVLVAELALRGTDAKEAVTAWDGVEKVEPSARAAYGAARAKYAAGDVAGAEAAAKLALTRNPAHFSAQLLLVRLEALGKSGDEQATASLARLLKTPNAASPEELVRAQTLLGDIHLARGHVALAESAYASALKINPTSAPALVGLGEAQFQGGRFSEALAPFEAASQSDPNDVRAQIGAAKSKLSLDRIEEATRTLAALAKAHPKDPSVALWYGRALEASGDRDRANAVYHTAIDAAAPSSDLVGVYVALATLQNQNGQAEEAQKTLAAAKKKLPESGRLHRALGHLALEQNRLHDATSELERALALDSEDLGARFELGVAQRRSHDYDAATKTFDQVAAADRDHPGLALERGLIFEATGHAAEALAAYEGALAKAPSDPELMLRVGCGRVSAGKAVEAEELLRKVLAQRPASAETNHCLGRALLAEEKIPDAQRFFDRAVELDPRRAEYHLYAGWAANEAQNVGKADKELAAALAIDNSLADAYWQRGVLRARQGAVKDAVADLTQALKLDPALADAHAALADTYYDLGREHDALAEWQKAVQAQPDNPVWRFRYGKLLVTNQMNEAGRVELEKAIAWAEKAEQPPRWLWEAHHYLARALGNRPEAASHWEQFLRLGPRDSPYRAEAKNALAKLGRPWTGD